MSEEEALKKFKREVVRRGRIPPERVRVEDDFWEGVITMRPVNVQVEEDGVTITWTSDQLWVTKRRRRK